MSNYRFVPKSYIAACMQLLFWILAILISLGAGYWVYLSDRKKGVPRPWLTALLRTLVIFTTSLLLLAPSLSVEKTETQKPVIVFLQDNSSSIPVALKGDSSRYRSEAEKLLDRLDNDYRVVRWGFGSSIQKDTLFRYEQQSTDIAAAITQAAEFYGQQNLGALILASDGRFNQGLNPQFQDWALPGSLYSVALGDSAAPRDIRITNTYANRTVTLNSQFEIRADIVARRAAGYSNSVQLRNAAGEVKGNAGLNISTDRFDKAVSFTVRAEREGLHHYVIYVPGAEGEQNLANNRRDVFVEVVSEKKKILIAAAAPHPDVNAIREALSGLENYQLDVRTADKMPASLAEYQVAILHALPSQSMWLQQQKESAKAVWLIMGQGSNNQLFNQWQPLARLNVNPGNLQPMFAAYNNAFNSFTLPSGINAVMDKMPPLAVPAGTIQANPNAQVLFSAKGGQGVPLWMIEQGTRPSALLVGEGLWRWRLFEYRHFNSHQVIDEAIRQTVSFLSANVNDRPFRVELPKYIWSDGEAVSMNAYLLNNNNEQINTPEAGIVISDSAGRRQQFSFERLGNGYRLNIGRRPAGTYHYTATTVYNGRTFTATGSFAVQRMPLELLETGADYPLLYGLARKYGGALVPGANIGALYDSIRKNPAIRPVIQSYTETIPLVDWRWYFFLILLLAATEWFLRKYWMAQ